MATIKSIILKNFRGYRNETIIPFESLTVFVGRNDIGKSTVLEALDIFFNDSKGIIALEKNDINKEALNNGDTEIIIGVEFVDLPSVITIDTTNITTLADEYLLNSSGNLTIIKRYKDAGKAKVFIKADHPSNNDCNNLLSMIQSDLKKKVVELGIDCDKTRNAEMRKAIWKYYLPNLALQEMELEVSNTKDSGIKDIYTKLDGYLPMYSLFQSDRNNSDKDKEAQDPMKEAVKLIMSDASIKEKCKEIADTVTNQLRSVTSATLAKLREMNPEIANSLSPRIPSSDDLKWCDVFKAVSISGDNDIPINKHGSGVKRLVLLNFFRAEAERMRAANNHPSVIYAIEEPETSQHVYHQKLLIDALAELSQKSNVQVILTTHSSFIIKHLNFNQLRLIKDTDTDKVVEKVQQGLLPYVSLNEINCLAFGDYTVEYHNELYGYIQSKAIEENESNGGERQFDNWLVGKGLPQSKSWVREINGNSQELQPKTLQTYIRNMIHHPENKKNEKYTDGEIEKSIREMETLIRSLNDVSSHVL